MSYLGDMDDPPVPIIDLAGKWRQNRWGFPVPMRPNTYVGDAAPLVPRTITLSLTAEDWDEVSRISWKRGMNDEILLSLMVASRLAGDRAEGR